ncbi:MAG TPA: hypothetical protein VED41_12835 [Solirubrobacteraceae bacterium]|nr:hypothetical protein [Solirubrobacteraceae bacterium]
MIGDDRPPVGEADLFGAIASGDEVDSRGGVMNDVNARWRADDERPVEPLEVFAHQTARQEVVSLDRLSRGVLDAAVAHPAVALRDGPVVQTNAVARLVVLGLERIQGELPAWIVEEKVVGLCHVVHARAWSSRLNHVHSDVDARLALLARRRDHALKSADAPWPQSDYRDA